MSVVTAAAGVSTDLLGESRSGDSLFACMGVCCCCCCCWCIWRGVLLPVMGPGDITQLPTRVPICGEVGVGVDNDIMPIEVSGSAVADDEAISPPGDAAALGVFMLLAVEAFEGTGLAGLMGVVDDEELLAASDRDDVLEVVAVVLLRAAPGGADASSTARLSFMSFLLSTTSKKG